MEFFIVLAKKMLNHQTRQTGNFNPSRKGITSTIDDCGEKAKQKLQAR
tara:strand:+ start:2355 stop:2498 length:144 start_codon:yes stop_codon:yes gene_type:complete